MNWTLRLAQERSEQHRIRVDGPSVRLIESALLGNGGLGVMLRVRPDAIVLHFAHNAVWDRRIDESHAHDTSTFEDVFGRIAPLAREGIDLETDEWFKAYRARMVESYSRPYPRPFPCGTVVLGINRRRTTFLGYELDILTGTCRVQLIHDNEPATIELFVDQESDDLHLQSLPVCPFDRLLLIPDSEIFDREDAGASATRTYILPKPGSEAIAPASACKTSDSLSFRQELPGLGNVAPLGFISLTVAHDAAVSIRARTDWYGNTRTESDFAVELSQVAAVPISLSPCVHFTTTLRLHATTRPIGKRLRSVAAPTGLPFGHRLQSLWRTRHLSGPGTAVFTSFTAVYGRGGPRRASSATGSIGHGARPGTATTI